MPASNVRPPPPSTLPLGMQPYHIIFFLHFTIIVLFGTFYSILTGSHHTNLHTTLARSSTPSAPLSGDFTAHANLPPVAEVAGYWADRKNLVNQLFVKRAWFWTTLAWAVQCFVLRTHNGAVTEAEAKHAKREGQPQKGEAQGSGPVARSVLRWTVATGCWRKLFTSWFFGPPLAERILTATGGICIPSPGVSGSIDASYCRTRSTITSTTHPALFSQLSLTPAGVPITALRPLWRGGHDISGHTFLMVLSGLYLLEEIAVFLPHLLPEPLKAWFPRRGWSSENPFVDTNGDIKWKQVAALAASVAVVALWSWMLLMTAVYFHTPLEKFTGLGVAFACWAVLPKGG